MSNTHIHRGDDTAARGHETIELFDTGVRLRLDDHAIDERPWWHRLRDRRRGENIVLTGVPPRPEAPSEDVEFPCPQCGEAGRTDIHDRFSGRRYMSCPSCFKMWQLMEPPSFVPDVSWSK